MNSDTIKRIIFIAFCVCFVVTFAGFCSDYNTSWVEHTEIQILKYVPCLIFFSAGAIVMMLIRVVDWLRKVEYAIWNKQPVVIQRREHSPEQNRQ